MTMNKHYHAAQAASFLSCCTGERRDSGRVCAVSVVRFGAPTPLLLDPAAKMVSTDARAVRAGQGKTTSLDQNTSAIIDVVRVVRVVRAKNTSSHTCARTRACEYYLSSYSLFFSIKENTLTTLTTLMIAGLFALTSHPDQA